MNKDIGKFGHLVFLGCLLLRERIGDVFMFVLCLGVLFVWGGMVCFGVILLLGGWFFLLELI